MYNERIEFKPLYSYYYICKKELTNYKARVTTTATDPKLVSISRQELSTHIINIITLRESLDDDIRFLFVDALPISRI